MIEDFKERKYCPRCGNKNYKSLKCVQCNFDF